MPLPTAPSATRRASAQTRHGLAPLTALFAAVLLGLGGALPGAARVADPDSNPIATLQPAAQGAAVELTFLKSLPGERERLVRFLQANWLEMDRIATERGLMRDYRVLDTGSDEGAWNVLVEVTYRDARGYAGIAPAFEAIRAGHTTVLIDGKDLRALGRIVESRKTYLPPETSGATR